MLLTRLVALGTLIALQAPAAAIKVVGSTTVNPVVAEAAELLRAAGATVEIDTLGGSAGGFAALAEGRADLGMSSRPVTERDRRRFAGLRAHVIGYDAVALVVSRDVVDGGVRAATKEQLRAIYEGRLRRWSELGGADRRIVFFDKEPGRGTWEVFATWLYGSADAVPRTRHREVGSNEEVRTKVATTPGAISQLSVAWLGDDRLAAIAIVDDDGRPVEPTPAAIAAGRYPIVRPLLLMSVGPPTGAAERLISLLQSERGQAIVARHGYLPLAGDEP